MAQFKPNQKLEAVAAEIMLRGIKLVKPPERKPSIKCTDIEMINIIKQMHKILGRVPKTSDIEKLSAANKIVSPSFATFNAHFGNWAKALEAAGIKAR